MVLPMTPFMLNEYILLTVFQKTCRILKKTNILLVAQNADPKESQASDSHYSLCFIFHGFYYSTVSCFTINNFTRQINRKYYTALYTLIIFKGISKCALWISFLKMTPKVCIELDILKI